MKYKSNFSTDEIYQFKNSLEGTWALKVNKAGNLSFCYADKDGSPVNPTIYYTMYRNNGRIYFRCTRYGYQYQLFRSNHWERFDTITEAAERFNRYSREHTEYLYSGKRPYFGHGYHNDYKHY